MNKVTADKDKGERVVIELRESHSFDLLNSVILYKKRVCDALFYR